MGFELRFEVLGGSYSYRCGVMGSSRASAPWGAEPSTALPPMVLRRVQGTERCRKEEDLREHRGAAMWRSDM